MAGSKTLRPVVAFVVLLVAAVSASPAPIVTPVAEMAKRATPVEKRDAAVITPGPRKRADNEERDLIGNVLAGLGLSSASSSDDGSDDGGDGGAYNPGGAHADVATPRGWKRTGFEEDVSTPRGWVKEKREPLAEAAANKVALEEKRGADYISPRPWKRDAMPTPRPFVA